MTTKELPNLGRNNSNYYKFWQFFTFMLTIKNLGMTSCALVLLNMDAIGIL